MTRNQYPHQYPQTEGVPVTITLTESTQAWYDALFTRFRAVYPIANGDFSDVPTRAVWLCDQGYYFQFTNQDLYEASHA